MVDTLRHGMLDMRRTRRRCRIRDAIDFQEVFAERFSTTDNERGGDAVAISDHLGSTTPWTNSKCTTTSIAC